MKPAPAELSRRLAAAGLALFLFACERNEAPVSPRSGVPKKLDAVRMNVNPGLGYAPLYIAKDEGYFAAEGIDAIFAAMDTQNSIVAITTGSIDVLSTPLRTGLFNVILRGVPVQVVAERGHYGSDGCRADAFTAPPETAARIARKGFRGEKFSLIRGGNMEYQIDQLLHKNGLTIDDVTLVLIPQGGSLVTNQSRKVDAVRILQEPVLSGALASGSVQVVATLDFADGQPNSLIAFGKKLTRDDPGLGRRFMRAYLRGVRRLAEGKTDRNVEIITRNSGLPADVVRRSCWQPVATDGRIDPAALEPFFAWARRNGHLEAEVPASLWWNPSFVDAASRDLGNPGSHPGS